MIMPLLRALRKHLKQRVHMKEYRTFDEAYNNIKEFIGIVYNKKRLHSSINE